MKPFTYDEALAFIHGTYGLGKKDGLSNMHRLLTRLGDPQERFASVHVAGTNGKGSVCAYVHAALCYAGYKVGLYTSPFLQRYNERMRVNGTPIPDDTLTQLMDAVAAEVLVLREEGIFPTEFEIGTALAFMHFAKSAVDIAVIEVGLGGRLDPTNVIVPRVAAIASIGLDHTHVLGDTLEAIAAEKAGIAKPGVPLILSAQANDAVREVVSARCMEIGSPFIIAKPTVGLTLSLEGPHQAYNAGVAVELLAQLQAQGFAISDTHIVEGLCHTRWPGRLEWVAGEPPLLMDGAHNPQGAQALAAYVQTLPPRKNVLLCGIMQDKDWRKITDIFALFADEAITVAPDNHRALDPGRLAEAYRVRGIPALAAETLPGALEKARAQAGEGGRIIAAGSLYLVGALRTLVVGQDDALFS